MSGGVLVVGDVIDDVLVRPEGPIAADTDTPSRIDLVAGGSAANTACWLAAAGTPATLVATVGRGDRDRHATALRLAGVESVLATSRRSTGTIVVLSQGTTRAMLTDRGANADTAPAAVTDALLAEHRALHVTGHVFTGTERDAEWRALLTRAHRAGLLVSVAPGSAGLLRDVGRDRFRAIAASADVLVAGLDEALLLTGEEDPRAAAAALARDHALVAVTLGAEGSLLARGDGLLHVAAAHAEPVDVTGAGDAYAAGLLAGLVGRRPDAECGQRAAALAARAVETVGARP